VALEFRNGRRAKDRWSVNRLLTLVGRAPDCKIHLTADDISPYHCGLVSTRCGLWVVDLSGRGVVVNGERMRVAPLPHSAELWIGRFLIACQYQIPPTPRPAPVMAPMASGNRTTGAGSAIEEALLPLVPTADEVEFGTEPEIDGLPASHIMADAFRQWEPNSSGPISNPIQVTGTRSASPTDSGTEVSDETVAGSGPHGILSPLLHQLAELHARSDADFQQGLLLIAHLFARVKREHAAVLFHELSRIREISSEIAALKVEVSRLTLERVALDRATPDVPRNHDGDKGTAPSGDAALWASPSMKTPLPDMPLTSIQQADPADSSLSRGTDRLTILCKERADRWNALLTLFGGS
jgi:hypothetical protein